MLEYKNDIIYVGKMFPTQMVFVGLENSGVYEVGLDLKVLRKGTETYFRNFIVIYVEWN